MVIELNTDKLVQNKRNENQKMNLTLSDENIVCICHANNR